MDAVLIGYFLKQTLVRPPWVHNDMVAEIASVSECLSPGPTGWIEHWLHNDYGVFDSPEKAYAVLDKNLEDFDLYAYKLYPIIVHQGSVHPTDVATIDVEPLDGDFHLLGYDAVSRSQSMTFECSPLSCNDAARDYEINRHCLFASYESALGGAVTFSKGSYEPGPYYVVEVFRRDRRLSAR